MEMRELQVKVSSRIKGKKQERKVKGQGDSSASHSDGTTFGAITHLPLLVLRALLLEQGFSSH